MSIESCATQCPADRGDRADEPSAPGGAEPAEVIHLTSAQQRGTSPDHGWRRTLRLQDAQAHFPDAEDAWPREPISFASGVLVPIGVVWAIWVTWVLLLG